MKKKKKSFTGKHLEGSSKKYKDENPDKRYPNPDDSHKETGPPIKERPISVGPHHPHNEEIL